LTSVIFIGSIIFTLKQSIGVVMTNINNSEVKKELIQMMEDLLDLSLKIHNSKITRGCKEKHYCNLSDISESFVKNKLNALDFK
jgi:hypothetical protein